jgi:predicted Zn-dependent peptidase
MTLTLTGPSVSFQEALALLFQLFSETAKDKDALSKLKERILKEREDALNDPNQIAEALFDYSMYGKDSPYKRDLSNAELKQLTVERVIQSLRSLFSYPHEIGYYGPLSLSEAKNEFQPYYQDRTFRKTLPKWKPLMPLQVKKTTVYLTHFPDMVQATLYWYIPGNRFDRDQIPIVMLFNEYFGGGMSGIVFQEIREAKALAYATFASVLYSPKPYDRFCFFAFVGTQADKLPDAIQAMNALLTDFPVSSKVYSTAVNSLEQTILSTRFLRESKITHYFYLKELNLNQDIYKIVYERLPSYSLETVRAYHRAYLQGKPYALSVVGDPKRLNLAYLKSLGQVKVVPKNELFGY